MTEQAAMTPARAILVNLATGEERSVPRNPSEVTWTVESEFERSKVPGLSHQPQQFIAAGNLKLEFEIETLVITQLDLQEVEAFRKFLLSLCVPRRGGADEISGGLPRVLIVWPNFCALTCFLDSPSEQVKRMNRDGHPVESTFKVKLEEVRDFRITSEDARTNGLFRGTTPGGAEGDD